MLDKDKQTFILLFIRY